METTRPAVTVVIATRNRPDALRNISLPSLKDQGYRPLRALVWDASDDDKSRNVVQSEQLGIPVSWARAPRVGSSSQRNDALRELESDVVLFMDDDLALGDGAVAELVACLYAQNGGSARVAGAQCAEITGSATQDCRLVARVRHCLGRMARVISLKGYAGSRQFVRLSGHASWLDPNLARHAETSEQRFRGDLEWITGSCMAYRLDAIRQEEVHFDESLERYGGRAALEDVLFSATLHARGWSLRYCYRAHALHLQDPSSPSRDSARMVAASWAYNRAVVWKKLCSKRRGARLAYWWSVTCDTVAIAAGCLYRGEASTWRGWLIGLAAAADIMRTGEDSECSGPD
jgi:GT2 family glycosyltransferase